MRDQVRALSDTAGGRYDIRIFIRDTNFDDARIRVVASLGDIFRNEHFRKSRVLIFQWGVYYDDYDIILAALPHQRTLTYFHNITPSWLYPDREIRASIERGEKQIDNLFFSDLILCNSHASMSDLVERGIDPARMEVLFPVNFIPISREYRRPKAGPAQLLYVGRFVPHKGGRELLCALAEARRGGAAPFHLKMVGALRYSDKGYIDELMRIIAANGLQETVTFLGELPDDALGIEFSRAHALVIPSYHEGFCCPVVEALSAGCYVIAFDGGNLPYLVGDLGTVVAAGDVSALNAALLDFLDRVAQPIAKRCYRTAGGELPVKAYEDAAMQYASRYTSFEAFRDKLAAGVERLLAASGPILPASPDVRTAAARNDESPRPALTADTLGDRLTRLESHFDDWRRAILAAQNVIVMQRLGLTPLPKGYEDENAE